jgi:16S rRNA processing protein RimM
LELGRVVRPHGLTGEVIVDLITQRTERLAPGNRLLLETGQGRQELEIERSRPHQHRFIVAFAGVTSREEADRLRQGLLLGEATQSEEGSLYVHELIGCELFETSGRAHGRVASVERNPASDLLVGEAGWLVPLCFVVSHENGRIVVEVPEGLFE